MGEMSGRSQELRSLMKQKSAVTSAVSGKDKAKFLKLMREKKKEPPGAIAMSLNPNPTDHISSKSIAPTAHPKAYSSQNRTVADVDVAQYVSLKEETKASEVPSQQGLPQGFFDDPVQDAVARGVDLKKEHAAAEEVASTTLTSFFGEVKSLDILVDEADEADERVREQDENAIQMSYYASLATLLDKSSRVLSKKAKTSDFQSSDNEIEEMAKESKEIASSLFDEEVVISASDKEESVVDSVENILLQKRKEKKRQRERAAAGDYIPIDVMDWTARSI